MTQIGKKIIKRGNFIYYIIAVVCAIAFFVHEFIDGETEDFIKAKSEYSVVLKEKKAALSDVKNYAKDSKEYRKYLVASEKEEIAWQDYEAFKKTENFLAFDTFQQFLGEFGWAFGLMIYCLFNFVMAVLRDRKSLIGEGVLHFSLLAVSAYYINWALFKFEDYQQIEYLIYSLLISTGLILSTYVLLKRRIRYITSLDRKVKLGIDNTKILFKYLWGEKLKNIVLNGDLDSLKKTRLDITHKVVNNEYE